MYDPMVAKLIVWDVDREHATRRMVRALGEYEIGGLKTLIPFHVALLQTEQWANGETCRDLLEDKDWLKTLAFPKAEKPAGDDGEAEETRRAGLHGRGLRAQVRRSGHRPALRRAVARPPTGPRLRAPASPSARSAPTAAAAWAPTSSSRRCRATCGRCSSRRGRPSRRASSICIIEAMKMENEIAAHKAGVIESSRSRRATP